MNAKQFYELLEQCYCDGATGVESVRSYSGRGMYGDRCIAVTGDQLSPFRLGAAMAEAARAECGGDWDQLRETLRELSRLRVSQDSMGIGTVLYWPTMEWAEGEMSELGDER